MPLTTEFKTIAIADIPALSARKKGEGWRFVQVLAVNTEDGIDVQYSFMKDGLLENSTVKGLTKQDVIPSITDNFLAAFVFENEIHDLFGVNIEGIAIDFQGEFYSLSAREPMTIITPEQKEAREKAKAKKAALAAAAAKKAAEAAAQAESPTAPEQPVTEGGEA